MFKKLVFGAFAMAAFMTLPFVASPAQAQHSASRAEATRIDGFDVRPVRQAVAGRELDFTLYGSPGGTAAVRISGATAGVVLAETETGVYEGTYTIRQRDKITARSKATANLRVGNQVASAILDEPLIGRANARRSGFGQRFAAGAKVDRFDVVDPPASLVPGEDLNLILSGSPGGAASAIIVGVKGKILLNEVRSGVYEGTHIITRRDRIAANSVVTGHLRVGERETNAVLGQSLVAEHGQAPRPRQTARRCVNCGVVEAINVVEVKGEGSYLGKIAGGVAGILIGSQVGDGSTTTVAQVAGAAGGAYVGNEIEKRVKTTKHHEVVVRLENGGVQTITYAAQPPFAVGARVKVDNGTLTVVQ
jgi:outer membrane lipoprotein SlyB